MRTISVVISAYNEEKKVSRLLKSVSWADEIIVIDNQSTDQTKRIAMESGATVFTVPNNPMLNSNKNFGFEKATKDWILNLDGDEEVTEHLKEEIQILIHENNEIDGYWIPRKNIIFGKWIQHGLWWPDKQLRLFRKGKGSFPCKHVHEYLEVEGKTSEINEPFIHYNYQTVSQFIRKIDTIYTENEVLNLQKKNTNLLWFEALRMPVRDFIKVYFSQQGYKDGLHGLVLAMLQAFYSFIVFAKYWESKEFIQQEISLKDVQKELHMLHKEVSYWEKTEALKSERNPVNKLLIKLKRKYVSTR